LLADICVNQQQHPFFHICSVLHAGHCLLATLQCKCATRSGQDRTGKYIRGLCCNLLLSAVGLTVQSFHSAIACNAQCLALLLMQHARCQDPVMGLASWHCSGQQTGAAAAASAGYRAQSGNVKGWRLFCSVNEQHAQ
jgi:hypothetical protein